MIKHSAKICIRTYFFFFLTLGISVIFYLLLLKVLPHPPATVNTLDLLPYSKPYIFPPYEKLFVYILAIFLIPLTVIFQYLIFNNLFNKFYSAWHLSKTVLSIVTGITLLITTGLIIWKSLPVLSGLPDIYQYDQFIFHPAFILFFLLGLVIISCLYFFPLPEKFRPFFGNITGYSALFLSIFAILLIIAVIFDRTMVEKNIFIGRTFQYVHSAVFVGPVHDILNGKVILVNSDSQYGILINYLPALIFKLISPFTSLSFTSFFYLMIVYGILYYICLFFLLRYRFKSYLWAFFGLFTLFTFHFYLSLDRFLRPMVFPIRYLLDMPFFLLLLYYSKRKTAIGLIALSFYLAFAILYNFETGISLSAAFLVYEFLNSCNICFSLKVAFKNTFIAVLILLSAILITGSGYSLYAKFISGSFPDWSRALFYIRIFGMGFISSNTPPLTIGFHLFPLAIYLIFIIKSIYFPLKKNYSRFLAWNGALTVYGLMIFIYYVERPYILNLMALSIPAVILGLVLFKDLYSKRLLFTPYLILSSFMVFGVTFSIFRFSSNSQFGYWKGDPAQSADLYNRIEDSAKLINSYLPADKNAVILSYYDTLIQLKAEKTNTIPYSAALNLCTLSQVREILASLKKTSPLYIFADSDPFLKTNIYPDVFEYIQNNYRLVENRGIISVWQKKN